MRRSLRMAHALYARPPGGACPALRWPAECWGPAGLLSTGGGRPPPAGGGTHLRPAAVPTTRRSHVAASAAASSSAPAPTGSTGVAGDTLEATRAAFVAAWTAAVGQLRRQEAAPVPGWWTSRREWRLWVCQLEAAALGRDVEVGQPPPGGASGEAATSSTPGGGAAPQEAQVRATPAQGLAVLGWLNATGALPPQSAAMSSTRAAAHSALVACGVWSVHENTVARRHGWPLVFPPAVADAAAALLSAPPPDPDARSRVDLTQLQCFTIDNVETEEIDDGVSVEKLSPSVTRVWVHIADPTRFLPLHLDAGLLSLPPAAAAVDAEAWARGSSVYFPTGAVPMMPRPLATGPMSLRGSASSGGTAVATSCALSIGADVDMESGEVLHAVLTPSTVAVTHKLTYDQADQLLATSEAGHPLALLAAVAQVRAECRARGGAVNVDLPQVEVHVTGACLSGGPASARVHLSRIDPLPPGYGARNLVQECMVLAGHVAAKFAGDAGIPFPYRSQSMVTNFVPLGNSDPPPEPEEVPPGPARSVARRLRLGPSGLVFTQPQGHAALGLGAYCQITSPIRRYVDLLGHAQIKALLRGAATPPFDGAALAQRAQAAAAQAQVAQRAGRESDRYWVAVWFAQQGTEAVYPATFLRWIRKDTGLMSVLLTDTGLEIAATSRRETVGGRQPGDGVAVTCTAAKPHENVLFFREAGGK